MRKIAKIVVALIAVGSLMFVGTSPASAKDVRKPAKSPSVSSTEKAGKTKKKDNKADKTKKQNKKAKKAKKAAKKAKKSAKAKNGKRVANFAPLGDSTSDTQTCDPMIDKLCQQGVDSNVVVDPTCDPAADVWCEIVVDPTCDPTVDSCDPIVDPVPTEEPTVDPTCDPTVDSCDPIVDPIDPINPIDPIIDPTPTEEPTVDPTPTEEPTVDPISPWWGTDYDSPAWKAYFASVEKANNEFNDFVATAQADFDTATADAKATRDAAVASATTFAEVVTAVREYRLATAEQQAKLQDALTDAYQALSILNQKAYDQLIADGGLIVFKCGYIDDDQREHMIHLDPMPLAPAQAAELSAPSGGKQHKGHHKRNR
jgi:Spy/CpxP family protein refolding chaperone